ncbi:MAG TPA: hypothetical protein VHJ17_19390 [Thermomonospora sp.]|nr:hypothetical protein [Thermomonospora sp.]
MRFGRSYGVMRGRVEHPDGGWERMWRDGIGLRIRRGQGWVERHWDVLDAHLG